MRDENGAGHGVALAGPRRLALLAVLLLVLPLLSCCGQGDDNGDGRPTLTYWANPMTSDAAAHAKVLAPLLDEFTEKTGVEVDLQMQDWSKVYPRLIAGIADHSLPDVFDIGSTWSAALQATGGLMPFDEDALAALGGSDRFLATSMASTGAPGTDPASIPLYGQTYALFYNPDLFARAGISEPPATWSRFVADARKLTTGGRWGVAMPGNSPLVLSHLAFIFGRQAGAHLFDREGRPQFDTPAERAAVGRLLDLGAVRHVVDPTMIEKDIYGASDAFAAGKAAMFITQASAIGAFRAQGFHDYAVAEVPVLDPLPPDGRAVQSMVGGSNLAISADTTHRHAALQLVAFLTGRHAQRVLNRAFGTIPVLRGLRGAPGFDDPTSRMLSRILARHAEPMPQVPEEGAMEAQLGRALTELWAKTRHGPVTGAEIGSELRSAEQRMPGG